MSNTDTSRPPKRKYTSTAPSSSNKRHQNSSSSSAHPTHSGKANPINPLKKRLRSLQRLLASAGAERIPADVQQTHERELASLTSQIASAREDERRKKCIAKYHMVRFFERRKAERRVKKAIKAVDGAGEGEEGSEVLKQDLHDAKVNLEYTTFYPLEVAYVSLFKDGEGDGGEAAGFRGPMWILVEEAMLSGRPDLQALRDGRWKARYAHWNNSQTNGETEAMVTTKSIKKSKTKTANDAESNKKLNSIDGLTTNQLAVPQQKKSNPRATDQRQVTTSKSGHSHEPRRIRRMRERGERITDPKYAKALIPPPMLDNDGDQDGKGMDFFEM